MYNGILNINKEKGWTSHDVINKLRRILGQKKIGHTGTLDPDATGVLPVCLGSGTKLCELLADHVKQYRAVLHLGVTTDTQDMSGEILETGSVEGISEEEAVKAVQSFVGEIMQVPPMYSALKVNGKKLCDLARRGIEVEREGRPVTIHEILIEDISLPDLTILVTCSKGTYIRTLCHDIGQKLGCGGCMSSLVRTQVGDFYLKDAFSVDQVALMMENQTLEQAIVPVDAMFPEAGKMRTTPGLWDERLENGNPIPREELVLMEGDRFIREMRVYNSQGVFKGLYEYRKYNHEYKPKKMFLQ